MGGWSYVQSDWSCRSMSISERVDEPVELGPV